MLFMKKLYLSTAQPYVNSNPHIGFALEAIQADVIARFNRLSGKEVFFLTGTDENSLKNVQAAEDKGMSIKEFVDANAQKFQQLKDVLNLSFDDFIRNTQERHVKGAQKLWIACQKDIYRKRYKGLYCVGCEEFYKENELTGGLCPEHKTKPEIVEEDNYFFRLPLYAKQIEKIIKSNKLKIIPETRKNEVLSFIKSGLQDFCISRAAQRGRGWGIPVPGDPSQIMWTWFDALSNYINALGYAQDSEKFQDWWQKNDNKMHVIGKGIIRFHAVYWIAMLLSAKISLPKTIFVHGYITSAGQKMSKSLGNVVDPSSLVEKYGGADSLRYFLLKEIPPAEDGDFTYEKFEKRYNADLAGGLGNFVARVVTLAQKFKVNPSTGGSKLKNTINKARKNCHNALEEFKFNEALAAIWGLISFCDGYIEENRPWEESKNQKAVIADLLVAVNETAEMLKPFLPETSEKILKQIEGNKSEPLFPRI